MTDTVTLNTGAANATDTTPAPEGHNAKMQAMFEASQVAPGAENAAPQKPEGIPDKFWKDGKVDVEGLAKSYSELEKKQSAPKEEAATVTPPATVEKAADVTPELAAQASQDQTRSALQGQGLDYDAIRGRFQETGELHADDRTALKGIGLTDEVIDSYVAGEKAKASSFVNSVTEVAGGPQEFAKIQAWAATGLTHAEKVAFNNAVNGSDVDAAKLAVAGLKQKFDTKMGQEPTFVNSGNTAANVGSVYRSSSEMLKDMGDPRYKSDPAFRNDVREKLARSSIM